MAFRFHSGAVGLDGDFVVVDDDAAIDNIWDGGGTSMAWIFVDGYGQNNFGRIMDKDGLSLHGWIWYVSGVTANNRFGFNVFFSTTDGQWGADLGTILTGQWYHVAVTFDSDSSANDPKFYIDGQPETVNQLQAPVGTRVSDAGARFLIGDRFAYDRAFDGRIADTRLYDRILSDAEILTEFTKHGQNPNVNGLAGRWPLSPHRDSIGVNTPWIDDTEQSVSNASSLPVTVPTHVDGDILVMVVCPGGGVGGTPANITTPGGWTQRAHFDFPGVSASIPTMALYTRTASSEPASYTVSWNQTCPAVAFMTTYRGIAEAPSNVSTNTGTSAAPVSPTITPGANSLVFRAAGMDGQQQPTIKGDFFAPNIRGRRVLQDRNSFNGCVVGIGEEALDGAATGTRTWSGAASDEWGALTATWNFGDGIEGLPATDYSNNKLHGETWHQVIGAEDVFRVGG